MLFRALLAHILSNHITILPRRSHRISLSLIHSWIILVHIWMLSHMEDRWCFARVIDDVVVDVVVVYYVGDIAAALSLSLNSLLCRIHI